MDKFVIGNVTAVQGVSVRAKVKPDLYQSTYFYEGNVYRGISINEFVILKKGYYDIVGKVEGEEIVENLRPDPNSIEQNRFDRFIDIKIIGSFFNSQFQPGIKFLPMIGDSLHLISDNLISAIYNYRNNKSTSVINIGKSLLEGLDISIPINGVYNSHLGIFGNTGSGKSNTLSKLYVSLFESVIDSKIFDNSKFLLIDFNGEYNSIHALFPEVSEYINLRTRGEQGDKIKLPTDSFWDAELLSVLFSATEKTQKPFLNHLVRNKVRYPGNLTQYLRTTLEIMFGPNQHKETVNLLKSIAKLLSSNNSQEIINELSAFMWHSTQERFKGNHGAAHTNTVQEAIDLIPFTYSLHIDDITIFEEIIIRSTLQLINSVSKNYVQYEHINPLISKISSMSDGLEKVLEISTEQDEPSPPISIISLRNCNQEIKKAIPMMLAKCHFQNHKDNLNTSFHFIIDEAHNILSDISTRESEAWKDYRLDLFEEIIKEGRKFGFFVTISSQRPADISQTIISQLHNYFIHRLVNENDLFLLKNTISTLDAASRSLIPTLPPGACILSGTAFHTPALVQIDKLVEEKSPASETINLELIWGLVDEDDGDEQRN
ncbi:ATP-binding protein [Enterobacter soli]|uniref:ATP-binding protein n=1 Tax=Enterobacter soli TaxID=885040 RepID=UPI00325B5F98